MSNTFYAGLKDILEDPSITKLFYDCREDCNALQHQYNVYVKGKCIYKLNSSNIVNKINGL